MQTERYLQEISSTETQAFGVQPMEFRYVPDVEEVLSLLTQEERVYLLPQTGFDMRIQVKMWVDTSNKEIAQGKTEEEVIKALVRKNVEDARQFCLEYIYRNLALPIPVKLWIVGNRVRIVPSKYSEEPYVNHVTEEEREGAVKNSILEVENFLTSAPRGSMAIATSPSGWSGLKDQDGAPKDHADAQTYLFRINELGLLEGVTLRTDMTLEENEALVTKYLGAETTRGQSLTEKERITKAVGAVITLLPVNKLRTFEEVIDTLEEVRGSPYAFNTFNEKTNNWEKRTFEEMRSALKKRRALERLHEKAEDLIVKYESEMKGLVEVSPENFKTMAVALGKTILEIFKDWESTKGSVEVARSERQTDNLVYSRAIPPYFDTRNIDYSLQDVLTKLQQIGGCNGGACGINSSSGSFIATDGLVSSRRMSVRENEAFSTFCPKCGKEVKAVVTGDTIKCQNGCTAKKPASISVG